MTDRTLAAASDLDDLDFTKGDGLLPVVAQNAESGDVLMVAYANREALERTLETGLAWFYSRSRSALWQKGETSGNTLTVESLHADCDGDTVLARVQPAGPACHTGESTCFGTAPTPDSVLTDLDATLARRASEGAEGSYTVKLLGDANLRVKKLGEETAELVAALATNDTERTVEEGADLLYHLMVALRGAGLDLAAVTNVLAQRRR
jgi:phosphoribosyl-ATP pyrophosphohydrolase/phosphoribosyl-AMP cyclohydrolase